MESRNQADKWYHPPTILTTKLSGNVDSTLNFTYTLDDLVKSIQQTGPNVTTKSIEYGYDNSARRTSLSRYSDLIVMDGAIGCLKSRL